ncbi:MbtH family protein [Gorillibacterium sp. sgz5001074]|uniref:MbtH family protein n=1 Tax=Gorillibacterium sp. sgz5001074 TaxID=3446695 RepID=UPI003F67BC09
MANPFERADALYCVLVNGEGQHSLWPGFLAAPQGWSQVFGQANRQACLDYVRDHWSDMRPLSVRPVADCV